MKLGVGYPGKGGPPLLSFQAHQITPDRLDRAGRLATSLDSVRDFPTAQAARRLDWSLATTHRRRHRFQLGGVAALVPLNFLCGRHRKGAPVQPQLVLSADEIEGIARHLVGARGLLHACAKFLSDPACSTALRSEILISIPRTYPTARLLASLPEFRRLTVPAWSFCNIAAALVEAPTAESVFVECSLRRRRAPGCRLEWMPAQITQAIETARRENGPVLDYLRRVAVHRSCPPQIAAIIEHGPCSRRWPLLARVARAPLPQTLRAVVANGVAFVGSPVPIFLVPSPQIANADFTASFPA